jgi:hypothetical protein
MTEQLNDLVDAKKIATGVVSRAIDALLVPLEGAIRKQVAGRRNASEHLLREYLVRQYDKTSSVKSLVHVGSASNIEDLYVPCSFNHGGHTLSEETFMRTLADPPRKLVIGSGGTGKSFFLRHTFIRQFKSGAYGIPIFVELRDLNESNSVSLFDRIISDVAEYDKYFMTDQLSLGLERGLFTLLFDGLDEVEPRILRAVKSNIVDLSRKYPRARIILTSRPIDGPEYWSDFRTYEMAPLDYVSSRQVVERSGIASIAIKKFLDVLSQEFFERHKSFLEIPLLAIVMALMFREQREITSSITLFYEDAYSALISRHDATKDYKRLFNCGLERSSFRAILNDLCARTYVRFKYSFTESKLAEYISESAAACNKSISPEDFVFDLITSASMIIRDGFHLRYSHRSFQEYFCACFVCGLNEDNSKKFLSHIGLRPDGTDVLKFVREINTDLYEVGWLLPSLAAVRQSLVTIQDLLDIEVEVLDHPPPKYECKVEPTESLGRVVQNLDTLGECEGAYQIIVAMTARAKTLFQERNSSAALPTVTEILDECAGDKKMLDLYATLIRRISERQEKLIKKRKARDTSMDLLSSGHT